MTWPSLPFDTWRDTYQTLHMWMQIIGKICLALTPRTNHFWNVAFRVNARGLVTPTMTAGPVTLTMTFDFLAHELVLSSSEERTEVVPLQPQTVAAFYEAVMTALQRLGVTVRIWPVAVEVPNPIRLDTDESNHSYDPESAEAAWRLLLAIEPVFESFRSEFIGKHSPVHFFWGAFDLASSRFSGRRAPDRPGADSITREGYSHEVISHGFWPGGGAVPEPVFYAYAAPEPAGFKEAAVRPSAAYYHRDLSEFLLPYEAVRTAPSPAADLRAFLTSTYDAGANLAGWNRADLERKVAT